MAKFVISPYEFIHPQPDPSGPATGLDLVRDKSPFDLWTPTADQLQTDLLDGDAADMIRMHRPDVPAGSPWPRRPGPAYDRWRVRDASVTDRVRTAQQSRIEELINLMDQVGSDRVVLTDRIIGFIYDYVPVPKRRKRVFRGYDSYLDFDMKRAGDVILGDEVWPYHLPSTNRAGGAAMLGEVLHWRLWSYRDLSLFFGMSGEPGSGENGTLIWPYLEDFGGGDLILSAPKGESPRFNDCEKMLESEYWKMRESKNKV